jgi:hypothetical protein
VKANEKTSAGGSAACPEGAELTAYVRGELEGEELACLGEHLARCEVCCKEVARTRAVLERLRAVPPEKVGRDLAPEIIARIPAADWTRRPALVLGWRKVALGLAAAAVAALAVTLGWRGLAPTEHRTRPEAVRQALDWLVASQEPTGEWRAEKWGGQANFTVGLTGLAVLALAGGRDEALEPPYARAVERAVDYLLAEQRETGRFGRLFGAGLYNHGIATVALLEVYGRDGERRARLRGPIAMALAYARKTQGLSGGWGYLLGEDGPSNASITVWQLHALELADALGFEGAEPAAARGLAWLGTLVDPEGRAGYRKRGDFLYGPEGPTAMAGLFLFATGRETALAKEQRAGMTEAVRLAAEEAPPRLDFYRSYFVSHALHAVGRPEGPSGLRETLVERQVRTGPRSGSWDPADRWGLAGGRVYSTAMAALSLEADRRAPELIAWMGSGAR